jgi:mRNA interferase MazF
MVMVYTPNRGDILWLQFNPQSGHEQSGRRPALVISPKSYNSKVGLALMCPITLKPKGYPFEVSIPTNLPIEGVILSDQIKSLDWQSRQAEYICELPEESLVDVITKLHLLIEL